MLISSEMVGETLRILAVDDNPSIREAMPFIFGDPHYQIASAADGHTALIEITEHPGEYDIVIVDQKMPQMTGVELVKKIRERDIPAKIMVLSAHLTLEIRQAYEQMGVCVILQKPFDVAELRLAVDQLAA
jgi:DNA-binding response OmpR family regulator